MIYTGLRMLGVDWLDIWLRRGPWLFQASGVMLMQKQNDVLTGFFIHPIRIQTVNTWYLLPLNIYIFTNNNIYINGSVYVMRAPVTTF